ncbi:MAG: hypothetical protein PHR39_05415, partial [Actinomycetota bacterium]|nr:hypothetical protein [Actinomycetota bacterium]
MFEKNYKSMNEQLVPDQILIDNTIKLIKNKTKITGSRIKIFLRKPLVITAMLLICIFAAIPVLVANVPAIYELMYSVSPITAQFFIPVRESCEDNGIKMEVLSTYIHDNTAEIYVALQDLTGNRVDETTDLYDSYSIHRPFDSSAHCKKVDYDDTTKTATFLIAITEWGNHKIKDDKLTFSVRSFISDKHEYENVPLNMDLSAVKSNHKTKTVSINGVSGANYEKYQLFDKGATVLVPSFTLNSPVEGIEITGIGYVDEMLHVQTAVKNPLKNDNHGYFFLKGTDSRRIEYDYSVIFTEYAKSGNEDIRIRYD